MSIEEITASACAHIIRDGLAARLYAQAQHHAGRKHPRGTRPWVRSVAGYLASADCDDAIASRALDWLAQEHCA